MKNPLQKVKQISADRAQKQEEAQQQKKARVAELESYTQKKGFGILHPVQNRRNKKEIETLKTEIANYETRKKAKKSAPFWFGALVILVIVLVVFVTKDANKKTNTPSTGQATYEEQVSSGLERIEKTEKVTEQKTKPSVAAPTRATEPSKEAETAAASEIPGETAPDTEQEPAPVRELPTEPVVSSAAPVTEPLPVVIPPEEEPTEPPTEVPVRELPTAPPTEAPTEPPRVIANVYGGRTVSLPPGTMVWLSATGSKFHRVNDCGRMNPNKARQVSVETAVGSGYEACEKCY